MAQYRNLWQNEVKQTARAARWQTWAARVAILREMESRILVCILS